MIIHVNRPIPFFCLFYLFFLVNGCFQIYDQNNSATIPQPAWHYAVDHFVGSIQSGPRPDQTVQIDPNTASVVTVTWVSLTDYPDETLPSLHAHIQRIITLPETKLIRPVVQFAQNARFGPIDNVKAFQTELTGNGPSRGTVLGSSSAVLPMGVCSQFTITPENVLPTYTQLQFCRPDVRQLQIALVTSALTPAEPNQIIPLDHTTETVILKSITVSATDQFALLLPRPSSEGHIATLGALIEVHAPGQYVEDLELVDLCKTNLKKTSQAQENPAQSSQWANLQKALDNLHRPGLSRRNLLFLATTTNAALAQEIALAGTLNLVHQLAADISVATQAKSPNTALELGWQIEQNAYALLLKKAEQEKLTPTHEAWLLLHAGQLGRDLPTLRELIYAHNSMNNLHKALMNENWLYLLDMSPAARTRAYEWLKTQGETVKGYDPLASAKTRRQALETTQEYYD